MQTIIYELVDNHYYIRSCSSENGGNKLRIEIGNDKSGKLCLGGKEAPLRHGICLIDISDLTAGQSDVSILIEGRRFPADPLEVRKRGVGVVRSLFAEALCERIEVKKMQCTLLQLERTVKKLENAVFSTVIF